MELQNQAERPLSNPIEVVSREISPVAGPLNSTEAPNSSMLFSSLVFIATTLFLAVIVYFADKPIYFLVVILPFKLGLTQSFDGYPYPGNFAMNFMFYAKPYLLFPAAVFLCVAFYRLFREKLNLISIPWIAEILFSTAIISAAFWLPPLEKFVQTATAPPPAKITMLNQETNAWKTYRNTQLGLSFNYPQYLSLRETDNSGYKYVILSLPGGNSDIFFIEHPKDLSAIALYNRKFMSQRDKPEELEANVNGIPGKLFRVPYLLAADQSKVDLSTVVISNDGSIAFSGISRDAENPNNALFDKILGTVKFDKKGRNEFIDYPDTGNWKPYTNPQSRFSLKIPTEWKVEETILPSNLNTGNRLSYTKFHDQVSLYDIKIAAFPLASYIETENDKVTEQCPEFRNNSFALKSGKSIQFARCEYWNKYVISFPDKNLIFIVYAPKGILRPPLLDSVLSTLTPP